MKSSLSISVVIITWNQLELLKRCLESLYSQFQFEQDEIIVVDNGSTDGTNNMIESNYPKVRYYQLDSNLGVGAARNRGIVASRSEYIMILDNDAYLQTSFISIKESIKDAYNREKRLGVLGFRLCFPDGSYQFNGRTFPGVLQPLASRVSFLRKLRYFQNLLDKHKRTDLQFEQTGLHEVDYLLGANQVFRKEVLALTGLYDKTIFFGPEDLELCWRFKKHGLRNMIQPSKVIIHDYQRRTTKFSLISIKHFLAFYKTWYKMHVSRYPHHKSI